MPTLHSLCSVICKGHKFSQCKNLPTGFPMQKISPLLSKPSHKSFAIQQFLHLWYYTFSTKKSILGQCASLATITYMYREDWLCEKPLQNRLLWWGWPQQKCSTRQTSPWPLTMKFHTCTCVGDVPALALTGLLMASKDGDTSGRHARL